MGHINDQLQAIKLKVKHLIEENAQLKKQIEQQEQQAQRLVDEMSKLKTQMREETTVETAVSLLHELAPTPQHLELLDEQLKHYIKQLNKSIELLSTTKSAS